MRSALADGIDEWLYRQTSNIVDTVLREVRRFRMTCQVCESGLRIRIYHGVRRNGQYIVESTSLGRKRVLDNTYDCPIVAD